MTTPSRRGAEEADSTFLKDGSDEEQDGIHDGTGSRPTIIHRSSSDQRRARTRYRRESVCSQARIMRELNDKLGEPPIPRSGPVLMSTKGASKLGTFSGVFVPTTLNVLSILMFLRFGMILGQSGLLGMFGMLLLSYLINLVTTLSISAIATNGTVRGGGAYYLISRSLGPEFGGSIGLVFYLGD